MAYKRVYSDKVKTYLQSIGLVGVPLLFGIFIYLNAIGDITITGHSGDVACFGILEDPCYAYINFTANKDIYIYPMPKGDTLWVFGTNETMKEIIMQRSWGTGWRNVDLNKTFDNKTTYAIKFTKGQNYQLRFIGYKNNPTDVVKWSFANLDPKWDTYKPDNFFTKLIENKADIASGYAIFEVYNPLNQQINIDNSKFSISYQKLKGNSIDKIEYFILKNITTIKNITDYSTICNPYIITIPENETIISYDNCTEIPSGQHIESKMSEEWVKFNTLMLLPKTYYKFKIIAYWKPYLGKQSIEWFPKINVENIDYVQNKWAWWDANWSKCKNITLYNNGDTTGRTNEVITQTLSGLTFSDTNEIRIVNAGCNDDGSEIPFDIVSNTTNSVDVIFLANRTASQNTTYSVYYDNAGASAPSYTDGVIMTGNCASADCYMATNFVNYTLDYNCGVVISAIMPSLSNTDMVNFMSGLLLQSAWCMGSTVTNAVCSLKEDGVVHSRIQCNCSKAIKDIYYYANSKSKDHINVNFTSSGSGTGNAVEYAASATTSKSFDGRTTRTSDILPTNEPYMGAAWNFTGKKENAWISYVVNDTNQDNDLYIRASQPELFYAAVSPGNYHLQTPTTVDYWWGFYDNSLDSSAWSQLFEINQTVYFPLNIVLGAEESGGGGVAAGTNISVILNTPNDAATVTSNPVSHVFTPTSYGDSIRNCSVYTNASGSWALNVTNTSVIANATTNTISVSYPSNAAYLWNVECYNSTTSVFASANRTFTLNVPTDTCTPPAGNWDIDCKDNCTITTNVVIAGNLTIYNSTSTAGNITFSNCNVTMQRFKPNATSPCTITRICSSGSCKWNQTG